jgi:hypothetical protein
MFLYITKKKKAGEGGGQGVVTFHCVLPEEGQKLYFTYSSIYVSITLSTKVKCYQITHRYDNKKTKHNKTD